MTSLTRFSNFEIVKAAAASHARVPSDSEGSCAIEYVDERKVAAVRASSPAAQDIERVAERFFALSDPTRVRLLHALSRAELCVCDLSKVASRSMPATSQQLQLLRRLGFVKYRTEGKLAYYSLADAWVRGALETALDELQEARR